MLEREQLELPSVQGYLSQMDLELVGYMKGSRKQVWEATPAWVLSDTGTFIRVLYKQSRERRVLPSCSLSIDDVCKSPFTEVDYCCKPGNATKNYCKYPDNSRVRGLVPEGMRSKDHTASPSSSTMIVATVIPSVSIQKMQIILLKGRFKRNLSCGLLCWQKQNTAYDGPCTKGIATVQNFYDTEEFF